MIQEGLLVIPGHDPDVMSFGYLAEIFRGIGIGFGRERYLDKLNEYEKAWAAQRDPFAGRDEDGEFREIPDGGAAKPLAAIRVLRRLVESVLVISPPQGSAPLRVFKLAQRFLEETGTSHGNRQLDNYAWQMLMAQIKEILGTLGQDGVAFGVDASGWLANLPGEAWVGGLGPRGGCLHVAHVLAGGHSGRPHTFIVGLDDGRFPAQGCKIRFSSTRNGRNCHAICPPPDENWPNGWIAWRSYSHGCAAMLRCLTRVTISPMMGKSFRARWFCGRFALCRASTTATRLP